MRTSEMVWALAIVLVLLVIALWSRVSAPTEQPYEKRPWLLTPAEQAFFFALEKALEGRYRIFSQVRLADIVDLRSGLDISTRTSALNRIAKKSIDFVVTDPVTFDVMLLIELNDSSHTLLSRRQRDAKVSEIAEHVSIPLLTFDVQDDYDVMAIKGKVFSIVRKTTVRIGDAFRPPVRPLNTPFAKAGTSSWMVRIAAAVALPLALFSIYKVAAPTVDPKTNVAAVAETTPAFNPDSAAPKTSAATQVNTEVREPASNDLRGSKSKKAATPAPGISARQNEYDRAWAAYYRPSAKCERNPTWKTTVDCGNAYMRAKKEFDAKWRADHGSAPSGLRARA